MKKTNYIHTTAVHNTEAANEVLPFVFKLFAPKTVVDVGCGTGTWLAVAKSLGATIFGVDGNYIDKELLCIAKDKFLIHDLTIPLPFKKKHDLALCLEVVEHLPESAAGIIIETLTNASDIILFSAAVPDQGGQNHINEQWPVYWQQLFSERKFYPVDMLRERFWENNKVDWWYKQNMFIYATEGKISEFKLTKCDKIHTYIHPELFAIKNDLQVQLREKINNKYAPVKLLSIVKKAVRRITK